MSYKVLGLAELTAKAPPGAPDPNVELEAALDAMEGDGWRLAGVVEGERFIFHFDDHKGRMGNLR